MHMSNTEKSYDDEEDGWEAALRAAQIPKRLRGRGATLEGTPFAMFADKEAMLSFLAAGRGVVAVGYSVAEDCVSLLVRAAVLRGIRARIYRIDQMAEDIRAQGSRAVRDKVLGLRLLGVPGFCEEDRPLPLPPEDAYRVAHLISDAVGAGVSVALQCEAPPPRMPWWSRTLNAKLASSCDVVQAPEPGDAKRTKPHIPQTGAGKAPTSGKAITL